MKDFRQNKKYVFLIVFVFSFYQNVTAQYYNTGQDPGSLRWNYIETPSFKVIFPNSIDSIGQQLANTLNYNYDIGNASLYHYPEKIPVILRNQTMLSNGFVAWAPKRTEFFTIPHQQTEPGDWLTHMAIHEYRHIVQIDKLNTGLTSILGYFFGETAIGTVLGIHIKLWFLEGDAVVTETAITESGRGRLPDFEMNLRSLVLEKGMYSYDKAIFGSYKDYVPNHYQFQSKYSCHLYKSSEQLGM